MNADLGSFTRNSLSFNNGVDKVYDGFGRGWAVMWERPYRASQINKKAENAADWFSALKGQGKGNGRLGPSFRKNYEMNNSFS